MVVVVVVVDKPVWPKGAVGGLSGGARYNHQPLPIIYVTNVDTEGW